MNTSSIIYFLKSSFKSMYKNGLMTVASVFVLIACMLIIGTVYLGSENVISFMNTLEAQNEIVAFIDDEYESDSNSREKLCEKVEAIDGVGSVEYITKEQALAEYRESLGDDGAYLDGYSGDENPLRNELRITISELDKFSTIAFEVSNMEEIANTRDSQEIVDLLLKVRNMLEKLGISILVILAVVSLFIISNTIKLTMYSRKNEINIMKYVGATNSFIRFPFVLEGVIIGLVSTLLSLALQWCIYSYLVVPLLADLTFLADSIVPFTVCLKSLIVIFSSIGLIVGIFGSVISIRKYLKV